LPLAGAQKAAAAARKKHAPYSYSARSQ